MWLRCDSWKWDYSDGGFFTIHSCYSLYALKLLPSLVLVEERCRLLGLLWESLDPPKTFVFAVQMLLSCIATFANLCIRGVIVGNDLGSCVWCPLVVELKDHLFCVVILQGGLVFHFWVVWCVYDHTQRCVRTSRSVFGTILEGVRFGGTTIGIKFNHLGNLVCKKLTPLFL